MFYRIFLLSAVVLLYVTGCGSSKDGQRCLTASAGCDGAIPGLPTQIEPTSSGFRCDAVASPNIVNANQALALNIAVTGGSAPFSVPEAGVTSFGGNTTIYGSYYNNTGSDRVVSRTLTVVDSLGRSTQCGFSVTVKSASASGLACDIAISPANPKQNQKVDFTITASGGTGTYQFSDLYLQSNWHVAPTVDSTGVARASAIYTTPGTRTASINVSNNGLRATCTEIVNVSDVSMTVVASPSSRVRSDQEISLKATLNGFSTTSTKTFKFESDDAAISVTQDTSDPSLAKVKSTDAQFHAFKVKVSVSSSEGETVQPVIAPLVIGTEIASSCTLDVGTGTYAINSPVTFTLKCSSAVNILDFDPGSNAVELASPNRNTTRVFKYLSTGLRKVTAKIGTNVWVSNIVEIRNSIAACSVQTNPNPSIAGGVTVVQTRFLSPIEPGTYDILITANGSNDALTNGIPNNSDMLNKKVIFSLPGNYIVSSQVTDRVTGQKISCSTTHMVQAANGLLASSYRIPAYQRNGNFRLAYTDWTCMNHLSNFVAANIDVPAHYYQQGFPGIPLAPWDLTWFAIRYQGFLNVPVTGNYDFQAMSDDGSILSIDGIAVVNHDGLHAPSSSYAYGVYLTAGSHPLTLDYFQGPATEVGLQLLWKKPGEAALHVIEPQAFSH